MHKTVVDLQTGEVTQVPLTPEEQAAFDAAQPASEEPAPEELT
jgi:hypothetical protein